MNAIFALSIYFILCALSQRYNPAFFPFLGSNEGGSDIEEEGTDYEGKKRGKRRIAHRENNAYMAQVTIQAFVLTDDEVELLSRAMCTVI